MVLKRFQWIIRSSKKELEWSKKSVCWGKRGLIIRKVRCIKQGGINMTDSGGLVMTYFSSSHL